MFEVFFQCGVLVLLAVVVLGMIGVAGSLQELLYHISIHNNNQTHHHTHVYHRYEDEDDANWWKHENNNDYGNPN